jgi:hypothetical protein
MWSGRRAPDFEAMAAILFLVAILGLLLAGRTQALAAYGTKPLLSFQLWQLAVALALPVLCAAQIPTISKVIAVAATAFAFSFSVHRARHAHDTDDLHF